MRIRLNSLYGLAFAISDRETSCERRGFRVHVPAVQERLERIGRTFLHGYRAALEDSRPLPLGSRLAETVPSELQGFAFEGAAMGLTVLDLLTPWSRTRLRSFLEGPGISHAYMVHVGAGWALARLRPRVRPFLERLDPVLRWLALDGYGFHEGYFHWPHYLGTPQVPASLQGYALHAFDQGLGRSLWFVEGADAERIGATIKSFGPERQSDLWSGVGLAAAYAGGVDENTLWSLRQAAGSAARPHLAQGAAFAAKARQNAGNLTEDTGVACRILCGMSAEKVALLTDEKLRDVLQREEAEEPVYELWRGAIRARLRETPEWCPGL
jgi:hypothetical protein